MSTPGRQFVRFLFLKLDPEWRRLPPEEQAAQKRELAEAVLRHHARLLLRTYSLAGTRGDADLLLWQAADDLEVFQGLQTEVFSTRMGGYLRVPHSFLGVTRRSVYEFPDDPDHRDRLSVRPQDSHYLFVYPFVKTREWYALPLERRQTMMEEHIRIGRKYAKIALNTIYSFGLDDQEFVVAFEGDDPSEFVSLVMELRESGASAYTLRDTPTFTCIQMSLWDALDSLGGAPVGTPMEAPGAKDGFVAVAREADLAEGASRRVYRGPDAIALFRVGGEVHAVSDRCTHGRASLSEGTVDSASCVLTCPWHEGRFDLRTGEPCGGPVRIPLHRFEVRVEDGWIHVR
jgi:chlorite dismutase/nitrite reductase/ring-hydroxylating ferredoxin subunit